MLRNFRMRMITNWRTAHAREFSSNVTPISMAYNEFKSPETNAQAPPLLVMHGLLGSRKNFRGISMAVERNTKRRIFSVDARNHGESPHSSEHSTAHMVADIKHFMESKNIQKSCLMGHSMGGLAMMHCALQFPSLVDRAIIVDISPLRMPRDFTYMNEILSAMKKVSVPASASMAEGRTIATNQIKDSVNDKATVDFIMMNLNKRPETGEFYWMANVEALHANYELLASGFREKISTLSPYVGPVSFICGSHSSFVDPDTWPAIQKIFPNSEIHWLDAGHLVHLEQPVEFIRLVSDFLKI